MADHWDVVVIGAGNAAFCAAIAAAETGASVLVLERAPNDENGGNSRFTAGGMRIVYNGVEDLKALMPDLTEAEIASTEFGQYTSEQFFDDMFRVTRYRTDPGLCEQLVTKSLETALWMQSKGVRFVPIYGRQSFKVGDKMKFWGGVTVESWGGGPGLVDQETAIARKLGVEIRYNARAMSLIYDGHAVTGVRVKSGDSDRRASCATPSSWRAAGFEFKRRMADPLSRSRLGTRESSRHALQYRRRNPHGARYRRVVLRQLVRMSRRRLGFQCAGIWRPDGRRQLSETFLSVQHHD